MMATLAAKIEHTKTRLQAEVSAATAAAVESASSVAVRVDQDRADRRRTRIFETSA